MKYSDIIQDKVREMDWQTALTLVDTAVDLHASRIKSEGEFSPDAVDASLTVIAAWKRIQRG